MLGHYRIIDKLGAGGMGDVYRAHDQSLGREVAIKLLPEEWASDTERLARFEREARLLAALNHLNVATVHGYEKLSDRAVLVMELVSGGTLRDRIGGSPMCFADVVPLFTQIASGLEAAHEKGIVHRDLKPPNVMVTESGQVKILDFESCSSVRKSRSTPWRVGGADARS